MTTIDQLARRYGAPATEAAYNDAIERKAANPLAYAERTLQNGGAKVNGDTREPVANNHEVCDACGASFFLNDFGRPINGQAVCNACRKARQSNDRVGPPKLRFRPPSEEERAWERERAVILARYEATAGAVLKGEMLVRVRQRIQDFAKEPNAASATWRAIAALCPEVERAYLRKEHELRLLGLRPLRSFADAVEYEEDAPTVCWTRAGKRLQAYWDSFERQTA